MGSQKAQEGVCPPDNPSVICFTNATVSLRLGLGVGLTVHRTVIQHHAAASLLYTREAFPLRRGFREATLARFWIFHAGEKCGILSDSITKEGQRSSAMKFSEMKYERPDLAAVKDELH